MNKNIICIISGPTATGKTKLSVEMARKFGGEIVNFDSLLFYKELNIGTAKPTLDEMNGVPHHLINGHSINNPINAADFFRLAVPIIEEIHARNKPVFLVGGSGFYLQAVLFGMFDSKTTPPEIQKKSDELYQRDGIEKFLDILRIEDPASFTKYHTNDHYRIRRAVEHFWATGNTFSSSREKMDQNAKAGPWKKLGWQVFHAYLDLDKSDHQKIIYDRTVEMIEKGLIEEVKGLYAKGFSKSLKPLQSIGYKETQDYLEGKINSLQELEEKITIATRQLAKAQRTWFKKQEKNSYNPITDKLKIFEDFALFIKEI